MTVALARLATAAAAMAVVLASCVSSTLQGDSSISTPRPVVASVPEVATPQASAPALAPLPPEIVGAWEVTAVDPNGGPQLLRRYRFFPDATYDYVLAQCSSSTECRLVSSESGYAQAASGVLSLAPQTNPSDGPRAYPYVVGRDPNVGDIQLHLGLADGQVDIFYFAP
jgi:hypothetical protein